MMWAVGISCFALFLSSSALQPEVPAESAQNPQNLLIEVYNKFSASFVEALAKSEGAETERHGAHPALSGGSPFGPGHILAVLHEKLWPLMTPSFEHVIENAPDNLPDSYNFMLGTLERDGGMNITNTIYDSENLAVTKGLNKLRTEIVKVDFKGDSVSSINADIAKKVNNPEIESYIPKESKLSQSAMAVIVNVIHIMEEWGTPWTKVNGIFAGERAEMREVVGEFEYSESEKATQIFIPFKNQRRVLSLLLPNDINDAYRGDLGEPRDGKGERVRVRLPFFTFTTRTFHKGGIPFKKCESKKQPNFFQILDDLVHVNLSDEKFEALSVAGSQINNVAMYKEEIQKVPFKPVVRAAKEVNPTERKTETTEGENKSRKTEEKVVVFDRPFTWTVFDEVIGPIFSGAVEGVGGNIPREQSDTDVFGLDKNLPFIACL